MYEFDWSSIVPSLPYLLDGLVITLKITVTAVVIGILWGTMLAVMRLSSFAPVAWFAKAYVNVFRSIPLVMVLLWFYLIVPGFLQNVLGLSPKNDIRLISAMVAFSMFEAAYYSEIIRAGIQSISRGQSSAALALGMTHWQSMKLIILPQAFRAMVPLLLTQGIVLFQDTSLVYVLSLADFFRTAKHPGKDAHAVGEHHYTFGHNIPKTVRKLLFVKLVNEVHCKRIGGVTVHYYSVFGVGL